VDGKNGFGKELSISIILLIVAVAITLVLTVAWLGVLGIPIGLVLISFSIWYFAMWFYKKNISFKIAAVLLILPILAIISFLSARSTNFFIAMLGLNPNSPPSSASFWVVIASFTYTLVLPLILKVTGIIIIIYFLRKQKSYNHPKNSPKPFCPFFSFNLSSSLICPLTLSSEKSCLLTNKSITFSSSICPHFNS